MTNQLLRHRAIRVAILDLYAGHPNQGMRCLREILQQYADIHEMEMETDEYEVRVEHRVPDLSYDVYISSGGPGSPLASETSAWEAAYFAWLRGAEREKRQVLFICHSFQLACRYFELADITRRKSTAFGVFPIHLEQEGMNEPVFSGLRDPFFAVDSRDYQVIRPDAERLRQLGAQVLAIEKERPHVPLERAVMAIRFSDNMIGTQFHPEADAVGMSIHLQNEERKRTVVAEFGEEKWRSMIEQLDDPEKIRWTYSHVIPNFLDAALAPVVSGHARTSVS
ncbi:MAG: GMP synthase [Bacteroidota bacterium]|nr:GMP synthase [Bacteroidota bacterium]MDP4218473.1 GMP synthase [Bacteroidota bacterium]MDP4254487.1 GMP synthase [Bacteroidota bacterium]MDP4257207.1 GMP synthase [Bacteroidota bacterium]